MFFIFLSILNFFALSAEAQHQIRNAVSRTRSEGGIFKKIFTRLFSFLAENYFENTTRAFTQFFCI